MTFGITNGSLSMLVDGKWSDAWQPVQATDAKGGFERKTPCPLLPAPHGEGEGVRRPRLVAIRAEA